MTPSVEAAIRGDLTPFAGAQVNGTFPLRETLLNDAMQQAASQSRGRIKQMEVRIESGNLIEFAVRIAVGPFAKWFRPRFILTAEAVENRGPVFVLTVASNEYLGLMWIAQVFASEYFPKGVYLDGRRILADLSSIPQAKPIRPVLKFVRGLRVRTASGIALIDFDLKVNNHESVASETDRNQLP